MCIQNRINFLSLNGKTSQEATKTGLLVWSITFLQDVAFPVSVIKCLQTGFKITLIPSIHQIHSKIEMPYSII